MFQPLTLSLGVLLGAGLATAQTLQPPILVATDGTQLWYNSPAAVYHAGKHQRTYLTWVTSQGALQVAFYDHQTRKMSGAVQIHQWDSPDDHSAPAIHVIKGGKDAGKLLLAHSKHSSELFVQKSTAPEDISGWETPQKVSSSLTTYPKIVQLKNQQLAVLFRNSATKPHYSGDLMAITSADQGNTWTKERVVLKGGVQEYLYTRVWNHNGEVAVAWNIYNGSTQKHQHLHFAQTTDLEHWFNQKGQPMDPACMTCARVYTSPTGSQIRLWDVAKDASGRPQLAALQYQQEYTTASSEVLSHRFAGHWTTSVLGPSENTYYPSGAVLDPRKPLWMIYPENTSEQHRLWMKHVLTGESCLLATDERPITRPSAVAAAGSTWVVYQTVHRYVSYKDFLTSLNMVEARCSR